MVWPEVDPDHLVRSASGWQIFPNLLIGHAVNHALCYSARPASGDPAKCIFEVAALELFAPGQAPATEWRKCDPTEENFGPILMQDFSNMVAVQRGMTNGLFRGALPNPYAEGAILSLHATLAEYLGAGVPEPVA